MKTTVSPARQRELRLSSGCPPQSAATAARNFNRMNARLFIALRKHAGLSHEEVAARAGISPSTVHTHERASIRSSFVDSMRICMALGFDHITLLHEVDRRLDEAGTPFLPDKKPTSERAFLRMRCSDPLPPPFDIPIAEIRRQLRLMRQLTLPKHPAQRPRKRAAASSRARAISGKTRRATKARKA